MLAAPIAPFAAEAEGLLGTRRAAVSGRLITVTRKVVIFRLFEPWLQFRLFAYVLNQLPEVELNHRVPRPRRPRTECRYVGSTLM